MEGALHVGNNLAGLRVQRIACILPFQRLYLDGLFVAFAEYQDLLLVEVGDMSNASIIIAVTACGVVLDKHHLGTDLQHQRLCRGVAVFWESPVDDSLIPEDLARKPLQFRVVVVVGHLVVGGQADVRRPVPLRLAGEWRDDPAVELGQCLCRGMPLTDVVEDGQERIVLLTVDLFELDGDVVCLAESLRAEEIGRVVIRLQQPLVFGSDDGRQLCQVANHQQLHAAKGTVVVAILAQHVVDSVQQVGAYHRYFVDNQQVDGGDNLPLLLAEVEALLGLRSRHVGRQRQLEERMDGDAAGIDGGHTGGGHNDRPLARPFDDGLQERGLARSCLACQEDAASCVLDKLPRRAQFWIPFCIHILGCSALLYFPS